MRAAYWACVIVGCGAVIVPVAPEVMAAYRARHPVTGCYREACHLVIPPEVFRPGGELWVPPGGAVVVTPPPGWSRDWGSNTAPWPVFQPPAAFGSPPVEIVTEEEDKDSPEKCYRLKHAHCRHHVDTPEPSSVLGFLTALVLLAGARRTRRHA